METGSLISQKLLAFSSPQLPKPTGSRFKPASQPSDGDKGIPWDAHFCNTMLWTVAGPIFASLACRLKKHPRKFKGDLGLSVFH